MIGINFGPEDFDIEISLFYRRYAQNCFNAKDVPIDKFSRNYLGLQLGFLF
jgi:hypothetical protein